MRSTNVDVLFHMRVLFFFFLVNSSICFQGKYAARPFQWERIFSFSNKFGILFFSETVFVAHSRYHANNTILCIAFSILCGDS